VHVRHEETAALAACAYGKFTGRPSACPSTAAPGAVHLMNGLYDARIDQSPVVAITGMTYHDVIGMHYLQDINHDYALNDACVYSQRIMGEAHVLNVVDVAVRSAIGARGPAAIAFPIDIQSGEAVSGDRSIKNVPGHSAVAAIDGQRIPPRERVEQAARILSGASKPLLFIGAGARGAGDEVERWPRSSVPRSSRRCSARTPCPMTAPTAWAATRWSGLGRPRTRSRAATRS
jgi:pyruvate dehydrogenase (quinone)